MKYEFCYGGKVACLPAAILADKLTTCSDLELRLICALSINDSLLERDAHEGELVDLLGCTKDELGRAFDFWRGAGALRESGTSAAKEKAPARVRSSDPHYTGIELAEMIESEGLGSLIDECQHILGITFNPTDANTVVSLHHYLGVDSAYILMLCEYCCAIGKRSLAYIRKTAYNLYDDGVDTAEKLDSYIRAHDELYNLEGKLRKAFGIEGRALTSKEKKCFETWCRWGFGEDIITLAYEITVEKTGKYTIAYLDRVLTNWHEAGFSTLEEIEEAHKQVEESKKTGDSDGASFELDEFYEAALKRTKENAVKLQKNKKSR